VEITTIIAMGKGNIKATMKRLKHRVFYEDLFVLNFEKFEAPQRQCCKISKTFNKKNLGN